MRICIKKLTFETIIGILEEERTVPQKVCVSLTLDYNYDGEYFINYADVCTLIEKDMCTSQYKLLEDALELLSQKLKFTYPHIQKMKLKIFKPDIVPNAIVGLILEKTF
ncbi:dihydroneopterin aldolase [Sulfuricurvum sp.]|uniref:dihydroneopterin aldolase n=1 Tax=Sulfuricurvum sp. TaxID=2025608 RepID=UPI00262A0EB9|nr:dihydroneopterin aldolase [Sulfuricurvum sp.]MDD2267845.1 dihydroneopterin aldolase [Sulfuricurvum sp.]